jgi:hypothetical protein
MQEDILKSPAQVRRVPMDESATTNRDSSKQKATRASFSSRVQHHIKEKSPVQVVNKPVEEASTIKKGIVVLESSGQKADLSVKPPVAENEGNPLPESSVQDILPIAEKSTKKRAAEEKAAASPKKKEKTKLYGGGQLYTHEERNRLFNAVNCQPAHSRNWELVKAQFDATAPPGAPCRSTRALQQHFFFHRSSTC